MTIISERSPEQIPQKNQLQEATETQKRIEQLKYSLFNGLWYQDIMHFEQLFLDNIIQIAHQNDQESINKLAIQLECEMIENFRKNCKQTINENQAAYLWIEYYSVTFRKIIEEFIKENNIE